jgi:LEA14-like dessication related protein
MPLQEQRCNTNACPGTAGSINTGTSSIYGPNLGSYETVVGPITPKAGEVISGKRISNPNGPCIVVKESNVTIKNNIIGPCNHSPDSLNTPWGKSPNGF